MSHLSRKHHGKAARILLRTLQFYDSFLELIKNWSSCIYRQCDRVYPIQVSISRKLYSKRWMWKWGIWIFSGSPIILFYAFIRDLHCKVVSSEEVSWKLMWLGNFPNWSITEQKRKWWPAGDKWRKTRCNFFFWGFLGDPQCAGVKEIESNGLSFQRNLKVDCFYYFTLIPKSSEIKKGMQGESFKFNWSVFLHPLFTRWSFALNF